jgi:hypothetical protein
VISLASTKLSATQLTGTWHHTVATNVMRSPTVGINYIYISIQKHKWYSLSQIPMNIECKFFHTLRVSWLLIINYSRMNIFSLIIFICLLKFPVKVKRKLSKIMRLQHRPHQIHFLMWFSVLVFPIVIIIFVLFSHSWLFATYSAACWAIIFWLKICQTVLRSGFFLWTKFLSQFLSKWNNMSWLPIIYKCCMLRCSQLPIFSLLIQHIKLKKTIVIFSYTSTQHHNKTVN